MPEELVNGLIATLRRNKDLFAWKAADMLGKDPDMISHKFSICREAKLVAQKRRKMGEEKRKITFEETEKLLQAGYPRSSIHNVANKCDACQKVKWKMENVYRLQRFK